MIYRKLGHESMQFHIVIRVTTLKPSHAQGWQNWTTCARWESWKIYFFTRIHIHSCSYPCENKCVNNLSCSPLSPDSIDSTPLNTMKPITLFWRSCSLFLTLTGITDALIGHVPNPSKVLIILEELGLPYQSSWVELENLKKPPFTDVNPNGRLPGTFSTPSFAILANTNLGLVACSHH